MTTLKFKIYFSYSQLLAWQNHWSVVQIVEYNNSSINYIGEMNSGLTTIPLFRTFLK